VIDELRAIYLEGYRRGISGEATREREEIKRRLMTTASDDGMCSCGRGPIQASKNGVRMCVDCFAAW
jgi:hypothetical protein